MRKTTKLALAFVALAGAVGTTAYAENNASARMREGTMMRLDKAMKDSNGTISFDQFSDAMNARLKKLVADNGGKLTVAQLADALEKARFEQMAKRIIARYDTKGDGTLTTDDITGREKKVFAMLDRNNDGKIEKSELPKGGRHVARHRSTGSGGGERRAATACSKTWSRSQASGGDELSESDSRCHFRVSQAATLTAGVAFFDRNAHRHDRADTFGRADFQRAALQLGQRARDGEAKAGPGMALGELVLHLFERPAELAQRFLRDAAAIVLDGQHQRAGGVAGAHRYVAALAGEFHRVRQKVDDDLLDRPAIGEQRHRIGDAGFDGDRLFRRLQRDDANRFADQRTEIDFLAVHRELAGLDLRHVEDVVDDAQQIFAAAVDVGGIFLVARRTERPEQRPVPSAPRSR